MYAIRSYYDLRKIPVNLLMQCPAEISDTLMEGGIGGVYRAKFIFKVM